MSSTVRIVTDYDGYPIRLYELVEVAKFRSMRAAAEHVGVKGEVIREAVNKGRPLNGHFFRYADMPVSCQPIKRLRRKRIPVVWEGKVYTSIQEAAGGSRSKYMKIWRSARRVRSEL